MKYLLSLLLFLPLFAQSQEPNQWEYCQMEYSLDYLMHKKRSVEFQIYYGSKSGGNVQESEISKDSMPQNSFQSPIEVYNFLGEKGWECFTTTQIEKRNTQYVVCFFKRRKRG